MTFEKSSKFLTDYGFKIVGAVIILTLGGLAARWIGKITTIGSPSK
jgi:hypothetical protein